MLKGCLPRGNTVNGLYYGDVLTTLRKVVTRKRGIAYTQHLLLLQEHAPSHKARLVQVTANDLNVEIFSHPRYSSDLAPSDFVLFPNQKKQLKGNHFDSDKEVSTPVCQHQNVPLQEYHFDAVQTKPPLIELSDKATVESSVELGLEAAPESKTPMYETEQNKDLDCKPVDHPGSGDVTGSQEPQNAVPSISRSLSDRICCRICQEDDTSEKLISPCFCAGSVGHMHFTCLEKWLQMNSRTNCELCSYPFPVSRVLPSLWVYLRHPAKNMDMPSLLCDVSCFFLLTPLLIASTYLCSIGVGHYHVVGKSESVFAVITLMISLITVYCAWATLAILYHRRVWLTWRDKNAEIHMLTDKSLQGQPVRPVEEIDAEADSTTSDSCGITSRQESASILLRPFLMFTRGRLAKARNPLASINIVGSNNT